MSAHILIKYKWLVPQESKSGLFCVNSVVLFFFLSKNDVDDNNVKVKKLANELLNKYAKSLGKDGDLEKHNSNLYRLNASTSANVFFK